MPAQLASKSHTCVTLGLGALANTVLLLYRQIQVSMVSRLLFLPVPFRCQPLQLKVILSSRTSLQM